MYLTVLKKIREKLLKRVSEERYRPYAQTAVGTGASGDKTFPIDRLAEDIILNELEASGLSLSIVSEEYGMKKIRGGGKTVLIDPIDGSKNAIAGIPFYCTSIAIAEGNTIGSVDTAYVINLLTGDEFHAERGKGAFLNNEQIRTQQDDAFYLVAYESPSPAQDIPRILPLLSKARRTRCLGATALDLAHLACGSVSVFVTPSPSRSFDFAGGWLLATEAGGICTDLQGNSIEQAVIGLGKSVALLASGNPGLHDNALRLLRDTQP